jgi:putative ABC transport system ATP-binding protein
VAEVVDAPRPDRPGGIRASRLAGRLSVRSPLLDFTAAAGEMVGIVAEPSHAAALVEHLAGARYAGTDDVQVDGTPVSAMDPAVAWTALLVARHDAHLFAGSVWDNVSAAGADEARARAAITAADVDEVARALTVDGLATVVTEQGRSLSGGQRQRVALARALAADPAVLVLHDPTTAVDAATEARIAAGLSELRSSRTTVIVATSPALLAACDRVLLVRSGPPIEGMHGDLVRDPRYRELVLS